MNYERLLKPLKDKIPLSKLLEDMGYAVTAYTTRPRKFSCTLHGDGTDLRKSACLYPDKDLWYCFACGKQRDIVATIREVNDLTFYEAVKFLCDRYNVKLDWNLFYADKPETKSFFQPVQDKKIVTTTDANLMLADMALFLHSLRADNNISPNFILKMYDILDLMLLQVEREKLAPALVPEKLASMKNILQRKMNEQFSV